MATFKMSKISTVETCKKPDRFGVFFVNVVEPLADDQLIVCVMPGKGLPLYPQHFFLCVYKPPVPLGSFFHLSAIALSLLNQFQYYLCYNQRRQKAFGLP